MKAESRKKLYGCLAIVLACTFCIFTAAFFTNEPALKLMIILSILLVGFVSCAAVQRLNLKDLGSFFRDKKSATAASVFLLAVVFWGALTISKVHESSIKAFVTVLLLVFIICGLLIAVMNRSKRIGTTGTYVLLSVVLSIGYQFVLPVGMVPDEKSHLDTAYRLSNVIMGIQEENTNHITMRREDASFRLLQSDVSIDDYIHYLDQCAAEDGSEESVTVTSAALSGNDYLYVFPAIGITFGRLLHWNAFSTFNLGRMLNLVFMIVITALAISIIPVGQNILLVTALMPTTLQQCMSYSYDVPITSSAFLVIAVSVSILADRQFRLKIYQWILLAVSAFVLFKAKSHAYFLLSFLPFVVMAGKAVKLTSRQKEKIMKWTVFMVILLACLVLVFFGSGTAARFIPETHLYLSRADGGEAYTLWYFAQHPSELLFVLLRTIRLQAGSYFTSYFGKWMGWFDINIGNIPCIGFLVLTLLAVLSEKGRINQKSARILFWLISVGTVLAILAGFLLTDSLISSGYIEGVQGRYFIPVVPLILITIAGTIKCRFNTEQNIYVYAAVLLNSIALMNILTCYSQV